MNERMMNNCSGTTSFPAALQFWNVDNVDVAWICFESVDLCISVLTDNNNCY